MNELSYLQELQENINAVCDVTVLTTKRLRENKGYLVVAPNGDVCIIEQITGGIIGWNDLNVIRDDINNATEEFLEKQIRDMKVLGETAQKVTNKEFWKRFKNKKY